jgi:dTDP-4-dehydrorhamnose 3,5-epimerase
MRFVSTAVDGAWIVEPTIHPDERGLFARTWDSEAFAEEGLNARIVQCSTSWNRVAGTLRGLHYQIAPHEEAKLVRCTAGAMFDVAVDLRRASATYRHWCGVTLSAENRLALYVPEGCAHGYLTLVDGTEVLYQMSEAYAPNAARGVRWNDPSFSIDWPAEIVMINERDAAYPDFGDGS